MLCFECPVRKRCLEFAISNQGTGMHGAVWLTLGKYAKNRNRHKTPEESYQLQRNRRNNSKAKETGKRWMSI